MARGCGGVGYDGGDWGFCCGGGAGHCVWDGVLVVGGLVAGVLRAALVVVRVVVRSGEGLSCVIPLTSSLFRSRI